MRGVAWLWLWLRVGAEGQRRRCAQCSVVSQQVKRRARMRRRSCSPCVTTAVGARQKHGQPAKQKKPRTHDRNRRQRGE